MFGKKRDWYTPSDFGFPFKEMKRIYIGKCGGKGVHWSDDFRNPWGPLAHTHICPKDPLKGTVCVKKKSYLFNRENKISEIMWHEYAHVITKYRRGIFVESCGQGLWTHNYQIENPKSDELLDLAHSWAWIQTMKSLGFRKPTKYCKEAIVEEDDDKLSNSAGQPAGAATFSAGTYTTQSDIQSVAKWLNSFYNWKETNLGKSIHPSQESWETVQNPATDIKR